MKPICLGRDPEEGHWFFYGEKEGVGRFIRYYIWRDVKYPHWSKSEQLPSVLSITQLPSEDIVAEVEQFSQGLTKYEVVPKVRGRSERVIRSVIDPNTGVTTVVGEDASSGESSVDQSSGGGKGRTKPNVTTRNKQPKASGNGAKPLKATSEKIVIKKKVLDEEAQITNGNAETKPKRKRRTKAQMELLRKTELPRNEIPAPEVEVAVVIKQKRKRRTKAEMLELKKSLNQEKPTKSTK